MGLMRLQPAQPVHVLEAWVRSRGRTPITVDGTAVADKATALAEVARAARFPDWFGHNLDALADSLGDLSWWDESRLTILWTSAGSIDALPRAERDGLLAVLDEAADDERLEVVLVADE